MFKVSVRHSLQWMKQPLAAVVLFGRTGPLGADKAQRLRIVAITTDRSNAAIGTNGYDDPARRCTDPAKAALLMRFVDRSEEHTSELQSLMRISYAVFCLKKKNTKHIQNTI